MHRRAWRTAMVVGSLALLGACASPPQVQALATGRADVSAWALQGQDMDQLRRTAQRLCPLGGEIVRQSARGERPEPAADGRIRQALQTTAQWFDPPQQAAQLVLLCREPGDRARLAPLPVPTPSAPQAEAASAPRPGTGGGDVTAGLPVGPITPEW